MYNREQGCVRGRNETLFNEIPGVDETQFDVAEEKKETQPFLETAISVCPHCGGDKFEKEISDGGCLIVECSICRKRIIDLRGV